MTLYMLTKNISANNTVNRITDIVYLMAIFSENELFV